MRRFYVYILSSRSRTLYVGMTSDIARRLGEHRSRSVDGFTRRYRVERLVYLEEHPSACSALEREQQIKRWRREKKVRLIETLNPAWEDLAEVWVR